MLLKCLADFDSLVALAAAAAAAEEEDRGGPAAATQSVRGGEVGEVEVGGKVGEVRKGQGEVVGVFTLALGLFVFSSSF